MTSLREDIDAILARMQPGTKWRTPRYSLIHVLAVVDDDQIVYKTWFKHKRRWHYAVEWAYVFWLYDQDRKLEQVKGRQKGTNR